MCGKLAVVLCVLSACSIVVRCDIVWLNISVNRVHDGKVQMRIEFPHSERLSSLRVDLQKAHGIASPYIKVIVRNGSDTFQVLNAPRSCHYRHQDADVLAVLNDCQNHTWVHQHVKIY